MGMFWPSSVSAQLLRSDIDFRQTGLFRSSEHKRAELDCEVAVRNYLQNLHNSLGAQTAHRMRNDIRVVAVDSTGPHEIRVLRGATGVGSVVQVLNPGSESGHHRTWHPTGYVHDRTTNPPSTTSTGQIPPPPKADQELWAREDLRAGGLSAHRRIGGPGLGSFVVDLCGVESFQRFEARYLDPATADAFIAGFAAVYGRIVQQRRDIDAGRVRFLVSFVPLGA